MGVTIDRPALAAGIVAGGAVAVPLAIAAGVVSSKLLGFVALVGVGVGAAVAARRQRRGAPLAHGLLTTIGLWAVLQVIRLVRLAVTDKALAPQKAFSNLLLALVAGLIGALVGSRIASRAGSLPSTGTSAT